MFVHLPQGRRSAGRGSRVGADGLLVVLAVAVSAVSGCGQGSTPHSIPPVAKSWDSLKWSGPVSDSSLQMGTMAVEWNGGIVAASEVGAGKNLDTRVRVSMDGLHWSDAATDEPSFRDAWPSYLVAGRSELLMLGFRDYWEASEYPNAWTSSDGRTWHAAATQGLDATKYEGLVSGPSGYVVWGSADNFDSMLWASSDGVAWRRVPPDNDGGTWITEVKWVAATATGYVAGGNIRYAGNDQFPEVAAWFSTDGHSWQRAAVEETPGSQATYLAGTEPVGSMGVGYVGRDGVISIGYCCATVESHSIKDGQTVAWLSTKGSTWRLGQDSPTELISEDWLVVADGGRIVAMNRTTMQIHESFDGITWREVPASGPAPTGLPSGAPTGLSSNARVILTSTGLLVVDPGPDDPDPMPARLWFATAAPLSGGSGGAP